MKSNAAIVYMTKSSDRDIADLKQSLVALDTYFNDRFGYTVVIFHEDVSPALQKELQSGTRSTLRFAELQFSVPDFVLPAEVPEKIFGRFDVGYRHMCRFFSGQIFHHPALREFDWYWRLDTDSFLRGPVHYDVFDFMASQDLWYGYIVMLTEKPEVVPGLWEACHAYAASRNIDPATLRSLSGPDGGYNLLYYYNNFEICDLRFGRSAAYQDYFDYIDRLGGIYKYRWGDAPIRTIGVAMLVPPSRVHRFIDIPYSHAGYYTHRRHAFRDKVSRATRRLLARYTTTPFHSKP